MAESGIPIGTVIADRYTVKEFLGKGGMAYVFSAWDKVIMRNVALKLLDPRFYSDDEYLRRFRMEARSAGNLKHPNIVQVYDVPDESITDGKHILVMELVRGNTLEDMLEERKFEAKPSEPYFSDTECAGILVQVLEGMVYAHGEDNEEVKRGERPQVVHRDIKPSNIMIDTDGKVKLADFGIAKIIPREGEKLTQITSQFSSLGTAAYMSPEQIRNVNVGPKSDVFSLGSVAYEMLTGTLPFQEPGTDSADEMKSNILRNDVTLPRRLNPKMNSDLEAVVLKALEKNPDRRYTSREFLAAVKRFRKIGRVTVEGKILRIIYTNRRHFLKTAGIAAIGTGLTSGAVFCGARKYQETEERRKESIRYESSIGRIAERLQEDDIRTWEQAVPVLRELSERVMQRFTWTYDNFITQRVESEKLKEYPEIFPFGSTTNKSGDFFFHIGTSSGAGYFPSMLAIAAKHFASRADRPESRDSAQLREQEKRFIEAAGYFGERIISSSNEDTSSTYDRFYYPVNELSGYERAERQIARSLEVMRAHFAEALKVVIELRYNKERNFFDRKGSKIVKKELSPDAEKDFRLALTLCGGLRDLDLQKEVFSKFQTYGTSVGSVEDYLTMIMRDTDSRLGSLVDVSTGEGPIKSQDYASLVLGLSARSRLFYDISAENHERGSLLEKNCSGLDRPLRKGLEAYAKKCEEAASIMIDHIMSAVGQAMPSWLDDREVNPTNNISAVRLIESMNYLPAGSFPHHRLRLFRMASGHLPTFYDEPPTSERPLGIVRQTYFGPGELEGMTNMETDCFYLGNLTRT